MGFLEDKCTLFSHTGEMLMQSRPFSCGDKELDNFFLYDAENYERQLLGKSYCYRLKSDIGLPQEKELKTRQMYFDLMLT